MVQVSKIVVDLGTPDFNQVFQDSGQIIIDFSSMHINEVYAIQSVVSAEIKLREHILATQVKDANTDIKKMKLKVQESK